MVNPITSTTLLYYVYMAYIGSVYLYQTHHRAIRPSICSPNHLPSWDFPRSGPPLWTSYPIWWLQVELDGAPQLLYLFLTCARAGPTAPMLRMLCALLAHLFPGVYLLVIFKYQHTTWFLGNLPVSGPILDPKYVPSDISEHQMIPDEHMICTFPRVYEIPYATDACSDGPATTCSCHTRKYTWKPVKSWFRHFYIKITKIYIFYIRPFEGYLGPFWAPNDPRAHQPLDGVSPISYVEMCHHLGFLPLISILRFHQELDLKMVDLGIPYPKSTA